MLFVNVVCMDTVKVKSPIVVWAVHESSPRVESATVQLDQKCQKADITLMYIHGCKQRRVQKRVCYTVNRARCSIATQTWWSSLRTLLTDDNIARPASPNKHLPWPNAKDSWALSLARAPKITASGSIQTKLMQVLLNIHILSPSQFEVDRNLPRINQVFNTYNSDMFVAWFRQKGVVLSSATLHHEDKYYRCVRETNISPRYDESTGVTKEYLIYSSVTFWSGRSLNSTIPTWILDM